MNIPKVGFVAIGLSTALMAQQGQRAAVAKPLELTLDAAPLTEKGTVVGHNSVSYSFSAKRQQTLEVDLKSSNASLYFNVFAADAKEAAYASALAGTGNKASVRIPTAGTYRLDVYLFRNAARAGLKAPFTLTLSLR